jgi:hypothetical protein
MANITYTYYVKYTDTGYYVATYYLHQQPVYTKDANGNILSSPAPYSADSYGYDYVLWTGGNGLDSTYVSSLPSAYFNDATTYSGDQGSTITLTYGSNSSLLKNIVGTFAPTERFSWEDETVASVDAASVDTASVDTASVAAVGGTAAPTTVVYPTLFPTLEPLTSIADKSLDFAFNPISYASTHLQKHNDSKHATLTITDTNNIMFNGQFLGESIALPSYIESKSGQYISKYDNKEIGTYVANHLAHDLNIHTFRSESVYTLSSTTHNAYKSAFGIISHTTDRGRSKEYTYAYAYIFNFGNGRLTTTIKDLLSDQIVGVNGSIFGGDRLKWDSSSNKYLLNQFDSASATPSFTDPIPTATSSKDGLFSKSSYSYVFSETGKLRTDVDALKKVTQAPCAIYVPLNGFFHTSAPSTVKQLTSSDKYASLAWNLVSGLKKGLQIIGYCVDTAGTSYINVSSAYYGYIGSMAIPNNHPTPSSLSDGRFINMNFTYRNNNYSSYMFINKNFELSPTAYPLAYSFAAYVSPLTLQQITSSNEGTFTK